jgi:hypothetical protein
MRPGWFSGLHSKGDAAPLPFDLIESQVFVLEECAIMSNAAMTSVSIDFDRAHPVQGTGSTSHNNDPYVEFLPVGVMIP